MDRLKRPDGIASYIYIYIYIHAYTSGVPENVGLEWNFTSALILFQNLSVYKLNILFSSSVKSYHSFWVGCCYYHDMMINISSHGESEELSIIPAYDMKFFYSFIALIFFILPFTIKHASSPSNQRPPSPPNISFIFLLSLPLPSRNSNLNPSSSPNRLTLNSLNIPSSSKCSPPRGQVLNDLPRTSSTFW